MIVTSRCAALAPALGAALLLAACSGDDPAPPPPECSGAAAEACACDGGGFGARACEGGAWSACDCTAPAICPDGLSASGAVHTSLGDVVLAGAPVEVESWFKQDVDAAEAGCIGRTTIRVGGETGCRLTLDLGPVVGEDGGLRRVTLVADSLCPGFPDADEGVWESEGGYGGWWSGPAQVAPASAAASSALCLQGSVFLFPDARIRLTREGSGVLDVNLKDLVVRGDVAATGDPSREFVCTVPACGAGLHDGGAGWCTPLGSCAPGYRDGGDGACVAGTACSPGYHDGGTGACVPLGACTLGYHDGGDGTCRLLGSCAPGYHDGGFGTCFAGTACEPGFRWDGGWLACTTWSGAGYPLQPRDVAFAVPLADGGLLYGGGYYGYEALASLERWDAATSTWTLAGTLAVARSNAEAVRLADGRVLIAGGQGGGAYVRAAEVYDPVTGALSPAGTMNEDRTHFTLTRLAGGKVVAVGGSASPATAEIWDPATERWTPIAPPSARASHTATALPDGRLLVAGGYAGGGVRASAEIYDPVSDAWTATGALERGRYDHAAVALPEGTVAVFGGDDPPCSAERWSPATGAWGPGGTLGGCPHRKAAALLSSGRVLVVENAGRSTEVWDPETSTLTRTGATYGYGGWPLVVRLEGGYVMSLAAGNFAQIYTGPGSAP